MKPFLPTAQPTCVERKAANFKPALFSLACFSHVCPPSFVWRMGPYSSPAQPICRVTKVTKFTSPEKLICFVQVLPPSSVCKMPLLPTTQPDCNVGKATEERTCVSPVG